MVPLVQLSGLPPPRDGAEDGHDSAADGLHSDDKNFEKGRMSSADALVRCQQAVGRTDQIDICYRDM